MKKQDGGTRPADVTVEMLAATSGRATSSDTAKKKGGPRGRTRSVIEINSELAALQAELAKAQQEHAALVAAEGALATR